MNDEELLRAYEDELKKLEESSPKNISPYSNTTFSNDSKQNLVEWELDFKNELEEIERLLRCDILETDENGNQVWRRNNNQERVFMNDLGVNDVLRELRLMVNKNKVLSNYTIEEINHRVKLIGHKLRILIYNNYETYGIDNEYKMHNYPLVVLSIIFIVEDAYRRALGGETHKGLAEQRLVTQNEPIVPYNNNQFPMQRERGKLNPMRYLVGK